MMHFLSNFTRNASTKAIKVRLVRVWKVGGKISWSGQTQAIKLSSCEFQCDIPHKWIKPSADEPTRRNQTGFNNERFVSWCAGSSFW